MPLSLVPVCPKTAQPAWSSNQPCCSVISTHYPATCAFRAARPRNGTGAHSSFSGALARKLAVLAILHAGASREGCAALAARARQLPPYLAHSTSTWRICCVSGMRSAEHAVGVRVAVGLNVLSVQACCAPLGLNMSSAMRAV